MVYDPELIQPLKPLTALEVTAGRAHSLVRTREGLVFAFGNTEFGQLGHGIAADQVRALTLPRGAHCYCGTCTDLSLFRPSNCRVPSRP